MTKKTNTLTTRTGAFLRSLLIGGWSILVQDLKTIVAIDYQAQYKKPIIALVLFLAPALIFWWIYVPVHEFFHVFGCWLGGGTVTNLEIDELYGGALFARWFSFVSAGSDYAGRLSGFDPGSDLGYLITDYAPFILSLLLGVPLLRLALRKQSLPLLGPGVILAMAPMLNLLGDFYEMGSILSTRLFALAITGAGNWNALSNLRSDDFIKLVAELQVNPAWIRFGFLITIPIILVGFGLGFILAGLTYLGSHKLNAVMPSRIHKDLSKNA